MASAGQSTDQARQAQDVDAIPTEDRDPAARNPIHLSVIGTRGSKATELQQNTANQNSDP